MKHSHSIVQSAQIVITEVLGLKKGEQFLILTNSEKDVHQISKALYDAALKIGAEATIVIQPEKTQLDFANQCALAAFGSNPEVCASISGNKMGKDREHIGKPFIGADGRKIDHIFHYLMDEKKTLRAIWTPGITVDMFRRTAGINYKQLQRRCAAICEAMTGAESIRVTAPGGTDITVPVTGRLPMSDDGNFTEGGSGGNIPAGEVFISPLPGKSEGVIVFDGSISLNSGDIITKTPVKVVFEQGYITGISGGKEAELLRNSIEEGEKKAREFEAEGKLGKGEGESYAENARGLGELGIGLNPAAKISGNMLEDEKAFHTCHFAIGSNYDNDAEAMIHLDCLVRNPTITVNHPNGKNIVIEKNGVLAAPFGDIL
ncbi:aminopeptidase [Brucepastera parasyntrophica]|uniref:aminopeptidase n=1 Tax=Brucepastera parasyntrophica TaxID=2880008 RepID=UPI00210D173F|nr:aminopeptidase [Brucepastera parasyntrophica]ULQ58836.1 aminopeptidase [Brucepastera parasyntrophica]